MTIKVKKMKCHFDEMRAHVIECDFPKYFTHYVSSTFFDYQFFNERPERMEHVSEQYIASKRINTGNIRILCYFEYNRHHQIESTCLEQKKTHTWIHVFIGDDITKLIFFIACECFFDDKMNFWWKQKSCNLSDTTLSFNTCSNLLPTRTKQQTNDIREATYIIEIRVARSWEACLGSGAVTCGGSEILGVSPRSGDVTYTVAIKVASSCPEKSVAGAESWPRRRRILSKIKQPHLKGVDENYHTRIQSDSTTRGWIQQRYTSSNFTSNVSSTLMELNVPQSSTNPPDRETQTPYHRK